MAPVGRRGVTEPRWGLEGATVVVTGAGSGIGQATARLFHRAGATVVAADLNLESAQRTVSDDHEPEPGGRGLADHPRMIAAHVDVRDERSVIGLVELAHGIADRLDVLVNVAGIGSTQPATTTSLQDWENVFAVNARGTFLCCKHALGYMVSQGDGVIVNISSVAGVVGLRNRAAYCASKGAVIAFSRAIAVDHVADGVRVNCICPGTVDSPWVRRLVDEAGESLEQLRARQPMGRLGTPDEIAQAALYLASDAGRFFTGSSLVIDGGLTAA
jgi:NAD(P)-dependent dehydrogenase (short-subunit alcohol dehydrogenase family)